MKKVNKKLLKLSKLRKSFIFNNNKLFEHYLNHCHCMCELINEGFFYLSLDCNQNHPINKKQQNADYKSLVEDSNFNKKIYRLTQKPYETFKAVWVVKQIEKSMDLLLSAYFSHSHFYLTANNLDNMNLVPVSRRQNRKILIKELCKKKYVEVLEPYKIIFNMQSGQWFIKSPIYHHDLKHKQFTIHFHQTLKLLLKKIHSIQFIFDKILRHKEEQITEAKKVKIQQILKYYSRFSTAPSISVKSDCAEYQFVVNRYAASSGDLQDLGQFNRDAFRSTRKFFVGLQIYGIDINKDNRQQYLQQISLQEKQKIQEQICIPSYVIPLSMSKHKENKYNFNNCYFLNTTYQERRINVGGNSEIFVLKPEIYEYSSTNGDSENRLDKSQNLSKYIVRHVVYKRNLLEKSSYSNSQNKDKNKPIRERESIDRQTQIVSCFRAASCLFLPKYYLNIEKNSPYMRKLFIEYLPGQTLDEYIINNSETISFFTKVYLILQILQAVRFISSFGIVHLDLKENNIIVLKKVICKIIDFGESYNYKICGFHHKPKYTLTYASPEVVTSVQGRAFTQKSDIFSLGIMIHRILYRKHPYFFSNQQSFQKSNFSKSLRKKTFFLPQQTEECNDKLVMSILHQLILKCIDMEESKRPYLDWITLVFKTCFNYLTTQ